MEKPIHPVVDLLEKRRNSAEDNYKLGLVVEGGGLRGALTAGMVAELHDSGYPAELFDVIIGSSAGAFNATYYISGNPGEGAFIYPNHLMQHKFVDYLGWLKRRPIMDLSVPVDNLLEEVVPLNWQRIIESKKLYIVVSDPHEVGTKVLPPPENKGQLKNYLRATAHIPVLAGKPPLIEDLPYYDGSLTAPLPIEQAVVLGATHVLALSTRCLKEWRQKQTRIERLASRYYDQRYPGIDKAIRKGVETAKERVDYLAAARDCPEETPFVYTIDVPNNLNIRQFESQSSKLLQSIDVGKIAVSSAIVEHL